MGFQSYGCRPQHKKHHHKGGWKHSHSSHSYSRSSHSESWSKSRSHQGC